MRRGWNSAVAGLACLIWLAGCGSSDSDEPAATGPVGEAMQVTGSVSVVHEGTEQPLTVGAKVFGADEIVTGADGAVTIRLFHNDARWTLESGKRKRVDTSLAWTAPKQAGGGVLAGSDTTESTAAAGRHAEKEAADTRATAALDELADEASPEPVAAGAPADQPASTAPAAPKPRKRASRSSRESKIQKELENALGGEGFGEPLPRGDMGGLGIKGTGAGGGGTIGTGTGIGNIGTTGKGGGYGSGSGGAKRKTVAPSVSSGTPSVSGGLDVAAIRRVIQLHLNQFKYCHQRVLAKQPGLAGKMMVSFTITAEGTVTKVKASADAALEPEVVPCVVGKLGRLQFPKPADGKPVQISHPLVFKAD